MKYTQFLIFEIGRECNLAREHCGKCPSGDPDRYGLLPQSQPTTDQQIIDALQWAYSQGFNGLIGWHYYNEPLLFWGRMSPLMDAIKETIPAAEFVCWTNGTQIGKNVQVADLRRFAQVWISDYHNRAAEWKALAKQLPLVDFHILNGRLDSRRQFTETTHNPRCLRPFNEFIVDYYGNGHLCCADWHGDAHIGSIHTDGYEAMFQRFKSAREVLAVKSKHGHPAAPAICRICRLNMLVPGRLVPRVHEKINQDKDALGL